ncbi:hypothetical protein M404DRAFT_1002754 [Pisolithus tinctorius Marx 270]|uniref:Uncharacterized protein n=1 Tax=Pisolithus tinctorius Marx 270 TaxID=870435 RepID=A0A0C3P3Y5_PISTI|nr:hypothetical protein M404DRAFT_1002754 [Pisolithus tinctorius Marx 270]
MVDGRAPADIHGGKGTTLLRPPNPELYPKLRQYENRHISTIAAQSWMTKVSPGRVKRGGRTAQKARGTAENRVRYDLESSKVVIGESPERRLGGSAQNTGRW